MADEDKKQRQKARLEKQARDKKELEDARAAAVLREAEIIRLQEENNTLGTHCTDLGMQLANVLGTDSDHSSVVASDAGKKARAVARKAKKDEKKAQAAKDRAKAKAARAEPEKKRARKKNDTAKQERRAAVAKAFGGDAKKAKGRRSKDSSSDDEGAKKKKGRRGKESSSDASSTENTSDESDESPKKKKKKKVVKYANDSTTSHTESTDTDKSTDTDSATSSDEPARKKRGGAKPRDTDAPHKKRGTGGPKGWRRELGSANAKNSRFEDIEFKPWRKKDAHRKEAGIVFSASGKSFGVFDHRAFKAVQNVNTLAVAHPTLRAMVVVLQTTYGPQMERLSEVLGEMTTCGAFPRSAELNVATDGTILCMLVAIHRCEVQTVHSKTVNQIYHTLQSPPSEWVSKITDIDSYAVETPITKTAHGYAGCTYTGRAGTSAEKTRYDNPRGGFAPRGGFLGGRGNAAQPAPTGTLVPPPPIARGGLGMRPSMPCNNCGSTDGHWGRQCTQLCTLGACVAAVAGVRADVKHTGATCPLKK